MTDRDKPKFVLVWAERGVSGKLVQQEVDTVLLVAVRAADKPSEVNDEAATGQMAALLGKKKQKKDTQPLSH